MVQYCCVPLCKGYGGIHFPKDKQLKDLWRVAVKKGVPGKKMRLWEPSKHDIVCHKHFRPDDYTSTQLCQRKRLKRGVVLSVFPERMNEKDDERAEERQQRKKRAEKRALSSSIASHSSEDFVDCCQVQNEIEISFETEPLEISIDEEIESMVNESVQCEILTDKSGQCSIDDYRHDPKAINYYTGFDDYDHFMLFLTYWDQQLIT